MRLTPLLALLSVTALAAQDGPRSTPPGGHWEFGVIRQAPDFSGSYSKVGGSSYDTDRDLGLGKDTTGIGALIEYEGRRFLLHMATYSQDYIGDKVTSQDVTINNTTYSGGTEVKSQVKLRNYELDWTIKVWRWDMAYLGLDLGFNAWNLNVAAQGVGTAPGFPPQYRSDAATVTVPIPQLGGSFGAHLGKRADFRAYYNWLSRSGATYHRSGADLRFYPMNWLGLRVNYESEGFNVPEGSIDTTTALHINKNGVGFGAIARF